ncbi:MAG: DUF4159 domain-containing protein [Planctomycetota bacterium]
MSNQPRTPRPVARVVLIVLASLLAFAPAGHREAMAQESLDPAAVLGAIDRGVSYLKRQQRANGRWDDSVTLDGGVTTLCTLALLNCGLDSSDAAVGRALDAVEKMQLERTYTVALQTMALCASGEDRFRLKIEQNVDWLEANQRKDGDRSGAWSYPGPGGDPSNTQFAVLALYEAQRIGVRVDPEVWRRTNRYWRGLQNDNGSWSYPGAPASGSMTCAGIGALVVISKALDEGDARVVNDKVRCCVGRTNDDAIDRALAWLARNFSVKRNPTIGRGDRTWHHYYLYGLERAGRLSARRFIGDHDWYREGTEYLVGAQDRFEHYWRGAGTSEGTPEITTALSLLFLSKGRRPVLMGKLAYAAGDPAIDIGWNAHRHDADHLTTRAEDAWDLNLTWQTIRAQGASVEDLLQTPVLYVSGSKGARLDQYGETFRDYIDRGGFVFAEACCGDSKAFRRSIEKLVERMFPEPEYRLRQLRPAHPIWRMERLVDPESPYIGSLWAVEYGCRTCMVFCDRDLSCYWELDNPQQPERYPKPIKDRIDDAVAIGLNVLAYATNREPKGKEQAFVEQQDNSQIESDGSRGVIQIAKLSHGGGCDDAPAALANLARTASRGEAKIQLKAVPGLVSIGDPAFFRHHLSFMHGRHDFRLTAAERGRLRQYLVERDGLLLADSICASPEFTRAFRRELLASIGGGLRLEQIPANDPLFTTAYGGFDLRKVTLRDPQPANANQPLAARVRQVAPQLEGVKIDGRWRVIFSPFDLSCALERHEAVECRGYSREDAARIGLNVLLYSINQ